MVTIHAADVVGFAWLAILVDNAVYEPGTLFRCGLYLSQ